MLASLLDVGIITRIDGCPVLVGSHCDVVAGLALLTFGGDWLADGAASLAANLRIEPVVIGITVVSIATSAPELFTCLIAGFRDGGDSLALGNINGSNLANVALILGISACICPIAGRARYYFWEIPW